MEVAREAWQSLIQTIRARREELGETAASVARKCGMARSYYSQIERGEILNPRLETADRVLRALGLDLTLGATPDQTSPTSLAYVSPFEIKEEAEADDSRAAHSAIRLLQQVLTDERISLEMRKLLEDQVVALIQVLTRRSKAKSAT